jgi:hypothetical protein
MPPQQRLGSYQEGSPTCPWEQVAECREDRPICWSIPHAPVELAFENTNLMSEHHDLDVFVRLASPTRHNKAEDATQADVDQGEGHGGSWPNGDAQCQSRGLIVVLVAFARIRRYITNACHGPPFSRAAWSASSPALIYFGNPGDASGSGTA